MTSRATTISIVLAATTLGTAYALADLWMVGAVISSLGLALAWRRHKTGTAAAWAMVVVVSGGAAVGAWLGLDPYLLLLGLIAALSAWDLDAFSRQVRDTGAVMPELEGRHLRRLLIVDGISLLLAVLALTVQLRLSFGLAVAAAIVALVGLSRAVGFFRRDSHR